MRCRKVTLINLPIIRPCYFSGVNCQSCLIPFSSQRQLTSGVFKPRRFFYFRGVDVPVSPMQVAVERVHRETQQFFREVS